MKNCPYCGYTGKDDENYCNKCGAPMTSIPDYAQDTSYTSSHYQPSETYTENQKRPKKKKSKAVVIILSLLGLFLVGAVTFVVIFLLFFKTLFIPRSFMNSMLDGDYDQLCSYFPDYIVEEQYGDDGEEIFESFKDNFEFYCGDDMSLSQYSVNLTKTVKDDDAEEMNEYFEDIYDDYEAADQFYCCEGTFTVKGDEDSIKCTFEAILCKLDGKYYLFSIEWDEA